MILTAHQPVYLPWIGLFHKIWLADTFVLFDKVQYLPKEWMNRNYIKTESGRLLLTVPVLKKGFLNSTVDSLKINNNLDWKRKHFKSIQLAYKKSKYYRDYIEVVENIYNKDWVYLSDLNSHIIKIFLDILNIKVKFLKASDFNFEGKKSNLVLDMCKKLGAKKYIFGSQGKNYAEKEIFSKSNIDIYFQSYNHPIYNQTQGSFISNLSIIDLIFNCGANSLEVLITNQNNFEIK